MGRLPKTMFALHYEVKKTPCRGSQKLRTRTIGALVQENAFPLSQIPGHAQYRGLPLGILSISVHSMGARQHTSSIEKLCQTILPEPCANLALFLPT